MDYKVFCSKIKQISILIGANKAKVTLDTKRCDEFKAWLYSEKLELAEDENPPM